MNVNGTDGYECDQPTRENEREKEIDQCTLGRGSSDVTIRNFIESILDSPHSTVLCCPSYFLVSKFLA